MIVTPLVLDLPDDCGAATRLLAKHYGHDWRVAQVIAADPGHMARVILERITPRQPGDGT